MYCFRPLLPCRSRKTRSSWQSLRLATYSPTTNRSPSCRTTGARTRVALPSRTSRRSSTVRSPTGAFPCVPHTGRFFRNYRTNERGMHMTMAVVVWRRAPPPFVFVRGIIAFVAQNHPSFAKSFCEWRLVEISNPLIKQFHLHKFWTFSRFVGRPKSSQ